MSTIYNRKIAAFIDRDTEARQNIWDEALALFHQGKFLDSIKKTAEYLDPEVKFYTEDGKVKFELKQGSVILFCRITDETVYAYINVLSIEYPDPIVYRRLLNLNATEFQSCRASIVKNFIRLTTETLIELASPSKLFWDLHELSTHGDKLDDILSIYSKGVRDVLNNEPADLPEKSIEMNYRYYRFWLKQALEKSEFWYRKNDLYVASWWLLGRIYSIIYFVQPEGKLYEEMQDIIRDYNNNERTHDENIKRVILRMQKLYNMKKEEVVQNFYKTSYIFQTQNPINRSMLIKYLDSSLTSADRFRTLGHKESEYISLVYGLGMVINNFVADDDFLKDVIEVYEMAHVDFMTEADVSQVRRYYRNKRQSLLGQLINVVKPGHVPRSLSEEKDLDEVIKRLRNFYHALLDGEL